MNVMVKPADLAQQLQEAYGDYLEQARAHTFAKHALVEARQQQQQPAVVEQFAIQRAVRPLFGKGEPEPPSIGTHPDFVHLAGTREIEYAPITTLFMDLEGSTRLSLFYSLEEVYHIKNAMISAAIEVIKAFDGHVHRIMGDAVIAFFGRRGQLPEGGVVDALNCASVLQYFVERSVRPLLQGEDRNDPFGIRIGIDFGPRDKVLWSSYGYPGVEEVTATSFHVDGAAKLQQTAPRNGVMLGDSLVRLVDFPSNLVAVREVEKDGKKTPELYLRPNYTGADGKRVNYRQHLLRWEEYLRVTSLGQTALAQTGSTTPLIVLAGVAPGQNVPVTGSYMPASFMTPKGTWLEFRPQLGYVPPKGSSVVFTVENHGAESAAANDHGHTSVYAVGSREEVAAIRHRRHTAYRGLHYMVVELRTNGMTRHKTRFGVYVQ